MAQLGGRWGAQAPVEGGVGLAEAAEVGQILGAEVEGLREGRIEREHPLDGLVASLEALGDGGRASRASIGRAGFAVEAGGTKRPGYVPEEWLSQPDFWATILHPDDRERAIEDATRLVVQGRGSHQFRWITTGGAGRAAAAPARVSSIHR